MFPANRKLDCQQTSNSNRVDAIGRKPATYGTDVHMFHSLDDDISIVLQYSSDTRPDREQIEAIVADLRSTVAATI